MGSFNAPSNVTGFADLAVYMNQVTQDWFWNLMIIALFVISFIALKNYPSEKAFAGASYIVATAAILMRTLGLVSEKIMFISIFMVGLSLLLTFLYSQK